MEVTTQTASSSPRVTEPSKAAQPAPLKLIPPADVYESQEGFLVLIDLTGVKSDGISLEVDKDMLTVTGQRPQRILPAAILRRSFALPEEVDAERISAAFDRGVLRLTLPRREAAKPRQIAIKKHG